MNHSVLGRVKEFITRLIKDQGFRQALEATDAKNRTDFLADQGYSFTTQEFESAAIELLDETERGEFTEVSESELSAVFGGYVGAKPIIQPMYGVIWWPPKPIWPRPQPLYGVVANDRF